MPLRPTNLDKFIDTPSDTCICATGPESTQYFLLLCPLFNANRSAMLATVNPIIDKLNIEIDRSSLE